MRNFLIGLKPIIPALLRRAKIARGEASVTAKEALGRGASVIANGAAGGAAKVSAAATFGGFQRLSLWSQQRLCRREKSRHSGRLPGFGLTLGLFTSYLSLLVLLPLAALILYSAKLTAAEFIAIATDERVISAIAVSFKCAFLAAAINSFFGFVIAWVLARYEFFGKKFVDAVIDLPFAIPTAVAGISLCAIFAPDGVLGAALAKIDVQAAYSQVGIVIALVFIGFPFIVRAVQPVLEEADREVEEAAATLGASFWTTFRRVIFPCAYPALLTGFAMAFARGIGEYGSVIFISSNMPYESEIAPLLIVKKLTQFDYAGASAIGVIILLSAFIMLIFINILQSRRRG
ncbi:MAG: sulfate ABC transporter permease subunit CysT [Helicobacteraceae bacterium]|jgi:sulfate transport system permease protein|nr:sulfate ABC transporter permease subunit CysT [Helicobacteraceae bacterium]